MTQPVKTSVRRAQTEQTEARIIAAATTLFVGSGYLATTITAVARAAGICERTVYVRFGTKAALFSRVVEVAIAGDTARVAVLDRAENQAPFSGLDATTRIEQFCHIGAQIMRRTGDLFAVAQQAVVIDPVLEDDWQRGRQGTRLTHQLFWDALFADGLLDASIDREWLIDTATILGGAESYLLGRRLYRWTIPAYERWLFTSYTQLAGMNSKG